MIPKTGLLPLPYRAVSIASHTIITEKKVVLNLDRYHKASYYNHFLTNLTFMNVMSINNKTMENM